MNGRYMRAAEIRWHKRQPERLRHIHQEKEKKKVSTVQIFDADLRFVNEILMPNTLAGIQYADQLAAENPGRLYVVMDEHRQKFTRGDIDDFRAKGTPQSGPAVCSQRP